MEGVMSDGMKSPLLVHTHCTVLEYLTKLLSAEIQRNLETSSQAPQDSPMETVVRH